MPLPPVLHVCFRNYIVSEHVLAIISADSAPMRRLVHQLKGSQQLIDATQGRKTKTLLFMTGSCVVLSAVSQETLAKRLGAAELEGGEE